jgi:hypothetical protein
MRVEGRKKTGMILGCEEGEKKTLVGQNFGLYRWEKEQRPKAKTWTEREPLT